MEREGEGGGRKEGGCWHRTLYSINFSLHQVCDQASNCDQKNITIIIEWLNSYSPMLNLSSGQKNYETYFYQSWATPVPATENVSITTMNHGPNYITSASVDVINGIY